MIVTTQPQLASSSYLRSARASGSEAAQEPQDQVEKSRGNEGVSMTVGGVLGIGLTLPCIYAGVIGGAVVGSMLGLGLGPIAGSMFSSGIGGMFSTIFQSTSTVAKAGVILGGISGLVGGWSTASAIGDKLGGVKEEPGKEVRFDNWLKKGIGTITVGGGAVAGGVGGGVLGASLASAGSLIHGLTLHGFNLAALSSMPTAALIGGGIGLVAFGAMGAVGGFKLAKGAARIYDFVADKVGGNKPEPPAAQSASTFKFMPERN